MYILPQLKKIIIIAHIKGKKVVALSSNAHCMELGEVWVENFEFKKYGGRFNLIMLSTMNHGILKQKSQIDDKYDTQ